MEDVKGNLAEELVKKCPVGVFDIEDVGSGTAIDCYHSFLCDTMICSRSFWCVFQVLRWHLGTL